MLPEAKKKLLDAAMQLMLKQGYAATSVDEICQAAGLTKGSLFHYFQGKEDLAKAAISHFVGFQRQFFDQAPDRNSPDPLKRIQGRLDLLAGMCSTDCSPNCCLIGNLTQELAATHPEIRECCAQAFDAADAEFTRDLAEAFRARDAARAAAGHKTPATPTADPKSIAGLYVSLIQGSLLLSKARQDCTILATNIEHFRRYLQTLLEPDKE